MQTDIQTKLGVKIETINELVELTGMVEGDMILMYIQEMEGGISMGRNVYGNPQYLKWMIFGGPIYNGIMGCAKFMDGRPLGIPISVNDIINWRPEINFHNEI